MTTVNDLLVQEIERAKADNLKLQERIKTVESTNRELRKENTGLNQDNYEQKRKIEQLEYDKALFDKVKSFARTFKEVFEIADKDHNHDGKYKSEYD